MNARILPVLTILLLLCLACSLSSPGPVIRDYGEAYEIRGDYWFHVMKPLTLASLHGRVVLVNVWKFT